MIYQYGDEIEVIVDRRGLVVDAGIGHLADNTMVVIAGAGSRVGEPVQAMIVGVERTPLGESILASAKS